MTLPVVAQSTLDIKPINWRGLHREYLQPGEMEIIVALVRMTAAKTMIEIGCRDGRTAAVLLYNIPTLERYIGIDVPETYEPGLTHQRAEMVHEPGQLAWRDPRFELIVRDHGSLDLAIHELPKCDAVFIDGDHSAKVVMHDSHLARLLLKPRGVVMWHDYVNRAVEVTTVLHKLADEGWPIAHIEGTWLAFMQRMEESTDADET